MKLIAYAWQENTYIPNHFERFLYVESVYSGRALIYFNTRENSYIATLSVTSKLFDNKLHCQLNDFRSYFPLDSYDEFSIDEIINCAKAITDQHLAKYNFKLVSDKMSIMQ